MKALKQHSTTVLEKTFISTKYFFQVYYNITSLSNWYNVCTNWYLLGNWWGRWWIRVVCLPLSNTVYRKQMYLHILSRFERFLADGTSEQFTRHWVQIYNVLFQIAVVTVYLSTFGTFRFDLTVSLQRRIVLVQWRDRKLSVTGLVKYFADISSDVMLWLLPARRRH